jgi:glycosyltransferase involved in cell wall biosynthesis
LTSFSAIIPSFNAASFVLDAVESCARQEYPPLEILVVDDGSTDATSAVVTGRAAALPSLSYIKQANQGVSAARNTGLARARGDYVVFLDADDRLMPGALASATPVTQSGAVVYGQVQYFGPGASGMPRRAPINLDENTVDTLFWHGAIPPGAFCVPRAVALEVGGFDRRFSYAADLHFWLRCGTRAPFRGTDQVTLDYRVHDASMTRHVGAAVRDTILARADFSDWCRQHAAEQTVASVNAVQLADWFMSRYLYQRAWSHVDELLKLSREHGWESPTLTRARRLRRVPAWVFGVKDRWDRSAGS